MNSDTKEDLSSDLESSPKGNLVALYNSPTVNENYLNPPAKLDLDQAKLLILSQQAETQTPLPSLPVSPKKELAQQDTFLPALLSTLYSNAQNNEANLLESQFNSNFAQLNDLQREFTFPSASQLMQPMETSNSYTNDLVSKTLELINNDMNKDTHLLQNSPNQDPKAFFASLNSRQSTSLIDSQQDHRNRLRRSPVYAYFTFLSETGEGVGYRCKLCGHTYQSFSSTTTFFKHLRRKHKIDLRDNKKPRTMGYDTHLEQVNEENISLSNSENIQQFEQTLYELNDIARVYSLGGEGDIFRNSISRLSEQLYGNNLAIETKELSEMYYNKLKAVFPVEKEVNFSQLFLNSFGKQSANLLDDPKFNQFIKALNPNVIVPNSKQFLNDLENNKLN
ncbi:hypothetical protein K502DRAFT_352943 [Neoconidiobolus thromboides FSU 785]|nr:hypothetical protein K502DRAFT_352943 [Neoconidiobolus thromboides FSU 785]